MEASGFGAVSNSMVCSIRAIAYKNQPEKIPRRQVDGAWIFMQNSRNFMQARRPILRC
jgi:hypothetical protein